MLEKQTDGRRWLVWGGFALWLIAAPLLVTVLAAGALRANGDLRAPVPYPHLTLPTI